MNCHIYNLELTLSQSLLDINSAANPVLGGSQGEIDHGDLHGSYRQLLASLELLTDLARNR